MKTYTRPMAGWWRRNPFYLWYMLREASCVFITAYALVLLFGLWRLSQGEGAFETWLESLASPPFLAFHAATLCFTLYHAWTWFKVMPRTMPFIRIGGRPVPDALIVCAGLAAAAAASLALFVAVWWFGLWALP